LPWYGGEILQKIILLKCIGGLGNQLFQVSLAYALSRKYDRKIYVDISAYDHYRIRNYGLNKLKIGNIIGSINNKEVGSRLRFYYASTQIIYRAYQYLSRVITRDNRIGFFIFSHLQRVGLIYNFDRYFYPISLPEGNDVCVYGYFQSAKYFQPYAVELRELLQVTVPVVESECNFLQDISNTNSVAISIRIGNDYLKTKSLNIFSEDYFIKAIAYLKAKINNPTFYIFSDSIDQVKKRILFDDEVIFIDGFDEFQNLRLMYSCKHFIISNSSFSWWGAFLSSNNEKIVVAPHKWYSDNDEQPDIYLNEMIRM
jgi:hypothetical protein